MSKNPSWFIPSQGNPPPDNLAQAGGGIPIFGHHGYWSNVGGKYVWVKSTLTPYERRILRLRKRMSR